ncbi:MAG: hypothetical protein KF802_04730 [Bdellovibrionaceae bacterium]|nr:hypothetical protein [Pseudobdellovibrionaceae bacterium]
MKKLFVTSLIVLLPALSHATLTRCIAISREIGEPLVELHVRSSAQGAVTTALSVNGRRLAFRGCSTGESQSVFDPNLRCNHGRGAYRAVVYPVMSVHTGAAFSARVVLFPSRQSEGVTFDLGVCSADPRGPIR